MILFYFDFNTRHFFVLAISVVRTWKSYILINPLIIKNENKYRI